MEPKKYTGINRILKWDAMQVLLDKASDGTFRDFINDWKWIFSFSRRYKWVIVFYTMLGIFSSLLSIASAYISRILINIITTGQRERLSILIACMVGSFVFSLLFSCVMRRVNVKISIRVNNDIQAEIFNNIIDTRWDALNKYQKGDLLNRFNSDVGTVSGNAIGWIPDLIISIFSFVVTFIVLFRMDPVMAFIAITSAPFLILSSHFIMRKLKVYRQRVLKMNSEMMSFEAETFYNFDTIKSFGVQDHYLGELKNWQKKYKEYNLDYNMFEIKTNIWTSVLSQIVFLIGFFYCLFRLWGGVILYGDMTFFITQGNALKGQFSSLVGKIPSMLNSAISAHRIRELVELPKEDHDIETLKALEAVADRGVSVHMKDVSYSYTDGQKVYENANLSVKPGEMVAVLSESGGGKTTLMRLLLGLVLPNEGDVVLKDYQDNEVHMNVDLRQLISYVPQGNTMLFGTIAENMRMAKSDASDEEIIKCLKIAKAWEFVEPIGLEGKLGERGRGISEGQAQRIAIARAVLRDAPILMLDEATSALDEETEEMVIESLVEHCKHKTIIVSTHRPSILKKCDRVYRIVEKNISACDELSK